MEFILWTFEQYLTGSWLYPKQFYLQLNQDLLIWPKASLTLTPLPSIVMCQNESEHRAASMKTSPNELIVYLL